MITEIPLELGHVVARLHADCDGRLPAGQGRDAPEREKNFLTRALAVFALHHLTGCPLDTAVTALVDGGGDFGLDAIYYSAPAATLWLVQSKFDGSGRGEPALGDVSKFCDGIDAILRGNFIPFARNAQIIGRQQDILQHLKASGLQVRAILVYSGLAVVSQERRHLFARLLSTFSPVSDYLEIKSYNLTSIHDWVTGADEAPGVPKLELAIEMPAGLRRHTKRYMAALVWRIWQYFGKLMGAGSSRLTCVPIRAQLRSTTESKKQLPKNLNISST